MTAHPQFRVLVADEIDMSGLKPLADDSRFELVRHVGLNGADLADAIAGSDAVLVRSGTPITREALARADRLRVIGRAGVGVDTIDVEAATEKGIAVLNAPAANTVSAAELTFALLLALVRRIPSADRSMRAGLWDRSRFSGAELAGKTLGLIGAGRVGTEVALRARAFDMRVVVFDPYLKAERARSLEMEPLSLAEVLQRADVLSLHVPLTDTTARMIGADELALMQPHALLVNAARGGVVDEMALVAALEKGQLAGAALDVFEEEPLPADHPLRRLETVIMTPHLGASTEEAQRGVAFEIALAVKAALTDGDLSRAVNAPAIGGEKMRRVRPLMDLAERLGRLARAVLEGPLETASLSYAGVEDDVLRPLAASALVGLLAKVVGPTEVNLVNALHLAESRGVEVAWSRTKRQKAYAEFIELRVGPEGGGPGTRVAGAILGQGHARVVRIGDYHVDIRPQGSLVVIRNRDVPGVIGHVGTFLGEAGLNIGGYHQARHDAGGEALAAISIDTPLSRDHIAALRQIPEVLEVRQANLDA